MKSYFESLLEILYPEKNTCFFCGTYDEEIQDRYICADCEKNVRRIVPPVCLRCSKPVEPDSPAGLCTDCRLSSWNFEMCRSPFCYEGLIKKGIYMFKYHNKPYFYKFFGKSLAGYMKSICYTDFDLIVPVPLHRSKMRKRGFNQSKLVASYISRDFSIPMAEVLRRIRKTPKQSEMSREERRANMEDAFSLKNEKMADLLKEKTVLLVDDVFTTGSTADECSKVLKQGGADKVYVITIAR
ncbi:MAG: ComF family protein [Sedimentibacter sp.]|uniref:ComF family protein n=1 Tax=Sedimentibacter sp. TaxID=1960295 RepID=UPI003158CA02